ncbi:hypothetical protein FACS1894178_5390 [Bacteroidia bacterium]|nr:hypothetical protein FACS1894178_5390 [Bacteroidia bacterium]
MTNKKNTTMKKIIYITIIIAALVGCKKDNGTYSLSYSTEKIAYSGGTLAVEIKSDFAWKILPFNALLYSIDKTNGTGDDVITITTGENNDFEWTDTIFVQFNGNENEVLPIKISQEKSPRILHVVPSVIDAPNTESTYTLIVTSNVGWTALADASNPVNLILSIATGGSPSLDNQVTDSVKITIPQNIDWNTRDFVINFTGSGIATPRSVTIHQAANGVVINGLIWSSFNVDENGTFVETPGDYGKYYQFNSPTPTWIDYGVYVDADWETANDPSPDGWRLPTRDEFTALRNYLNNAAYYKWETIPAHAWGATGIWIGEDASVASGENTGNSIFLPAAGKRRYDTGVLEETGIWGYYWSNTTVSGNILEGHNFSFILSQSIITETSKKARGCTIRPVRSVN